MRTLLSRAACAVIDLYLEFASEVVGKNAGKHVQLVAGPNPDRHVIHLAMRLEFGEDALLRPSTLMEGNDIARVHPLVGDDDLEFAAVLEGSEQVELDRLLMLAFDQISYEDEAVAGIP